MDSGAIQHIKDANVRRLQDLQDTAGQAFDAHVNRHKAEIARQRSYFQENFPLPVMVNRKKQKSKPQSTMDPAEGAAEELKVLIEIEKFKKWRRQSKPDPDPPLSPDPAPSIIAAEPSFPSVEKKKAGGFSLRNIFDLSPQFRDIETSDKKT